MATLELVKTEIVFVDQNLKDCLEMEHGHSTMDLRCLCLQVSIMKDIFE